MPLSLLPDAVQVIPHLPILCAVTWQDFVDSMPPWRALHGQVRHLHILPISYAPPPHYLDELTTRVRRDPTLSALEVLYLPTAWRGIGTAEGKAEWERVRDERSVEVEYEDEEEVAFPLDGWGRMLGAFRRSRLSALPVSHVRCLVGWTSPTTSRLHTVSDSGASTMDRPAAASSERTTKRLVLLAFFVPLLVGFFNSHFVRNIPFLLNPPDLPAFFARFPTSSGLSHGKVEHFTLRGSSSFIGSERLAYCEDAIPFAPAPAGATGPNLVLVSCDPNRKRWNTVMGPLADPYSANGALWVVKPTAVKGGEPQARKVELNWPDLAVGDAQFHPLGIEIVEPAQTGEPQRLLAVNHGANESTIEVFDLSRRDSPLSFVATHAYTLRHPSFTGAPNALAIHPSTTSTTLRFFLSQDHFHNKRRAGSFAKFQNTVETVTARPLARVDFVKAVLPTDKEQEPLIKVQTAVEGVPFVNGIALSEDGKTFVVASTTKREVRFYAISSSADGKLHLNIVRTVHVPMLVDNLSLLPSASSPSSFTVLAAGHPSYPALLSVAHSLTLSARPPAWLSRLLNWPGFLFDHNEQRGMSWAVAIPHPAQDGEEDGQTVFQSNGRVEEGGFGGSTTAVAGEMAGKAWMVVAGLYEEGVKVVRSV
ncbi:hypothetical protein JCM10207_006203 [Rhodosporidiobolus poonsookiae]